MRQIKPDFDTVVRENAAWLTSYVRRKMNGNGLYEDLVQEIFVKAFLAYDGYTEEGKIRAWLARIAENTLNNYFSRSRSIFCLSLDYETDEGGSLGDIVSDDFTPEERLLENETVDDILRALHSLPEAQRTVFSMRFLDGFSVTDVSERLGIPTGTVKSQTHYAVQKIRKEMGLHTKTREEFTMECKEFYKYLLVDALGLLKGEVKAAADAHIASCETCRGMLEAVRALLPKMQFGKDDETSYFNIDFPEVGLSLTGTHYYLNWSERTKSYMAEHDGALPEGLLGFGHMISYESLGIFDGKGNLLDCHVTKSPNGKNIHSAPKKLPYFEKSMWFYEGFDLGEAFSYRESSEAPGLFYGSMNNNLGANAKSMLYQAIPAKAENIRIKRGNGVIDCGAYRFAYVDRYVTEDETMKLEYSFQLK